jgi:hypothetical protein
VLFSIFQSPKVAPGFSILRIVGSIRRAVHITDQFWTKKIRKTRHSATAGRRGLPKAVIWAHCCGLDERSRCEWAKFWSYRTMSREMACLYPMLLLSGPDLRVILLRGVSYRKGGMSLFLRLGMRGLILSNSPILTHTR